MLPKLQQYYDENGISALKFSCLHYRECSEGCPGFTTAKEALVSRGYENHELPRLLFISLDSGSGETNPKNRAMMRQREIEETECNVYGLDKGKHWYRTHELAHFIYRKFKFNIHLEDVHFYFAHTNSAKCCMNNPQRAKAKSILFRNCRGYIPGEVSLLEPDIIITQGDEAQQSISGIFPEFTAIHLTYNQIELPEVRVISIHNQPVIWIHTFHPRNFGPFNEQRRDKFGVYSRLCYEFIKNSGRWKP
ncbi:MAG TPA: uracil-DNA glycosylase family protein [Anaerolineaceae bacterium]